MIDRGNLLQWLRDEESEIGQPIEKIVVGDMNCPCGEYDPSELSEVSDKLNVEFDSGFGVAGCPPVYAYTQDWIIGVGEYDGSTGIMRVPRHPVRCRPRYL